MSNLAKIEKTEVWLTFGESLSGDGRAIRGFFGNLYWNRPEFHSHLGNKLIYRHPLIQYKVIDGSALIVGLKEGAYLLKALPKFDYIEVHYRKLKVINQITIDSVITFGAEEQTFQYSFITPWIGLNKENYENYLRLKRNSQILLPMLNRIIQANILSMCKSLGYTVGKEIRVQADLKELRPVEIKENIKLVAFAGNFMVNFVLPDFWGIGSKVSFGYGTIKQRSEVLANGNN